MAKYVCNFEQVRSIGQNIIDEADNLKNDVNTYSTTIQSNLSSWEGPAATAFKESNEEQITTTTTDVEYINSVGEMIKIAADEIENLESELAGLSI